MFQIGQMQHERGIFCLRKLRHTKSPQLVGNVPCWERLRPHLGGNQHFVRGVRLVSRSWLEITVTLVVTSVAGWRSTGMCKSERGCRWTPAKSSGKGKSFQPTADLNLPRRLPQSAGSSRLPQPLFRVMGTEVGDREHDKLADVLDRTVRILDQPRCVT